MIKGKKRVWLRRKYSSIKTMKWCTQVNAPNSDPNDNFVFPRFQKIFGSDDEIVAQAIVYFGHLDTLQSLARVKNMEKHLGMCMKLKGEFVFVFNQKITDLLILPPSWNKLCLCSLFFWYFNFTRSINLRSPWTNLSEWLKRESKHNNGITDSHILERKQIHPLSIGVKGDGISFLSRLLCNSMLLY